MLFAISYGDGNNGLSRLHCNFTVEAPEGSEYLLAKLAALSNFSGSTRRYVARELHVDEMGSDGAQACVLDCPGSRGWSEHNGAWFLVDAYPASETTNADSVRSYGSPEAAFGRQLVRAHRKPEAAPMVAQPVQQAQSADMPDAERRAVLLRESQNERRHPEAREALAEMARKLESDLQDKAERLVQREVSVCLSHMVSTIAQGSGLNYGDRDSMRRGHGSDLLSLAEQAMELCSPIQDYEEAATQAGWIIRDGEFWDGDDAGQCAAPGEPNAWKDLCEEYDIEPYDREVYEHWAVSTWLAEKLLEAGERVDTDFANLNVWARTTTGQAISMDSVIRDITTALYA